MIQKKKTKFKITWNKCDTIVLHYFHYLLFKNRRLSIKILFSLKYLFSEKYLQVAGYGSICRTLKITVTWCNLVSRTRASILYQVCLQSVHSLFKNKVVVPRNGLKNGLPVLNIQSQISWGRGVKFFCLCRFSGTVFLTSSK